MPQRRPDPVPVGRIASLAWLALCLRAATAPALPDRFEPAMLVDPIYFLVEKKGQHRVLAYLGRTVLKTRSGDDLDALNVFQF